MAQDYNRSSRAPIVGSVHEIKDEAVLRYTAADFPASAFFGIDDDRQLEIPEDIQSRIIGGKVKQLDIVAFRVSGANFPRAPIP